MCIEMVAIVIYVRSLLIGCSQPICIFNGMASYLPVSDTINFPELGNRNSMV